MKVNNIKKTTVTILIFSLAVIMVLIMLLLGGCKKTPATTVAETTAAVAAMPETTAATTATPVVIKDLNVYVWEGYLPEAAVKMFEEETGLTLNITLATDNAMMLALLRGGGKADIVMPTQNQVNRFYEEGIARPLDLKNITNYEKVSKALREQPWAKWDGKKMGSGDVYVVPFVFGTSGIVVNTEKYTGSTEDIGWDILFDNTLKERVSSKNAPESLMICLDVMGIPRENLLTDTQNTLEKARPKAIELKKNVLKFYDTGAEILDLLKNQEVWVSHIWDGGGRKLMLSDPKFKYMLPKTGGFGWTDTFMIPSSAANPLGANKFIDFMLRPDIAAMLTTESGYTTTVSGALDMATGIDKADYELSDQDLAKLVWQPNFSEEVISAYTTFWEEISTVQ